MITAHFIYLGSSINFTTNMLLLTVVFTIVHVQVSLGTEDDAGKDHVVPPSPQ